MNQQHNSVGLVPTKIDEPNVRFGFDAVEKVYWWPGVATAASYFEANFGCRPHPFANSTPGRLPALRLPDRPVEPGFKDLTPFWPGAC